MADDNRPSFEERKKQLRQFDNVKQIKQKKEHPVITWLRNMFFSGRTTKDILLEVAEKQIVPQFKDNLRNSLVSVIDLKIYKNRATLTGTTPSSNFITNYVSFGNNSQSKSSSLSEREENKLKERKTIESGFESPAFASKAKADEFLASMHAYVLQYTMSVLDLAWMQRKTIDFAWDKWGWDKEEILAIKEPTYTGDPQKPWIIQLPKAHVLE